MDPGQLAQFRNLTDNQSASITYFEQPRSLIAIACILAAASIMSLCVALYALNRSDDASEKARLMERESRILEDDTKYIRAYLSARGIHIPANHEEAEQ